MQGGSEPKKSDSTSSACRSRRSGVVQTGDPGVA